MRASGLALLAAVIMTFSQEISAQEPEMPSLEFLEYLGLLVEQEDGEWIGPEDLDSLLFGDELLAEETQAVRVEESK